MSGIKKNILRLSSKQSGSFTRSAIVLCCALLFFHFDASLAQVISNTGGAVFTVTSGTVLTVSTIQNDNTPSTIENDGTIDVTAISNAGTLQGMGTYDITGAFTNTGTFIPLTSTCSFNGSGAQTIPSLTFYNLTLSNAGIKTAGGALTVLAGFTIDGSASFDAGTSLTHNFSDNWYVNTSNGTPLSYTTASTINFNTPGVAAATSISGTTTATLGFGDINVNNTSGFSTDRNISAAGVLAIASSVTFTNNATVSVFGNITGGNAASTFVNALNARLKAGASVLTTGTLTATVDPNTVSYTSTTAGQTVKATTYHHLDINNPSQVATINATMTVNGNLTVSAGTLTVSAGTFTVTGTTTVDGAFNMGAATAINLNDFTINNGTISITSLTGTKNFTNIINNGTLNFTAAETATLSGNLTMGNSSAISGSATGILNVGGNLSVTGTGTTIGQSTITVSGTTNVTGDVDFTSATGAKTFVGLVTISGSGTWASSGNSAFVLRGGLTHNGTSFSSGTGVYTFNTNPQSISGSGQLTVNSITVTGVTVSNDNTNVNGLTISTALAGTGELINPVNGLLNIGGTSTITTLTATAVPNTVRYVSTIGAQTVKATTYHHLDIDKTTQVATVSATTTVNGNLTVTSGTLTVSGGTFTANGATTINGTMTMGAVTAIAMNSTTNINGTLTITSATGTKGFTNINLNSNATWNLNAAETATLSGNLVLADNSVITGTNTGIINVGGNLNITGTGITIGRSTITVTGTTTVTGTVDFNSATGTKTFGGLVTISGSGSWSSSANSAFVLQGGLENDNTFNSGTGTYTFNTNSQTISGTGGIAFSGTVAIVGADTVEVTTTNSFGGSITGSVAGSTLQAGTGVTLNFLGAAVLATGTLDLTTNTPNTVVYGSTSVAQSIKGTTYYNLEINGNDQTKILGANTTVNNQLTVTAGTLDLSTRDLIMGTSAPIILNDSLSVTSATGTRTWNDVTINAGGTLTSSVAETFTVLGNWTNNGGTFAPGTSTVSFESTGPQAINGTALSQTFYNLTVNKSADVLSVGGSTTTLTVAGTFTQTLGGFTAPATLNIGVNWSSETGTVFTPGTGSVIFNGSGAQQILGTLAIKVFNNVEINKSVGTLLSTGGGTTAVTVNGTLTQTQGNFTPPATLDVSGITTLTDGTFSIGTGTKTFDLDVYVNSTAIVNLSSATGIANIGGNLNMNNTGSIAGTATGTINITGNLNLNGAGNTIGRSTINVNGATNVTGDVDFNSVTGTKTFVGLVTIAGSGSWASSGNATFVLRGGLTHNGTSFSSGTGVYTFNTNAQSIAGSSQLTINSLTVTGVTVTNDNTNVNGLTISTALAGTGGLTNPVNGIVNIGGTSAITTLSATAVPNTVRYISTTGAQTVKATIYHHLVIDNSPQTASIAGATTVNGDLTVASGTLAMGNSVFAVSGTTNVDGILSFTNATGTKDFVDVILNANAALNFTAAETATLSGNLTLGNSGDISGTATGIVSIGGNLNITGTGTTIGRSTITVVGATTVTGGVDFNSAVGVKTFGGLITLSGSGAWTNSANSAFVLQGGITHNGSSFASGSGLYTFNSNPQTIGGGSVLTFDNATITGVTVSNDNSNVAGLTISTSITGTGELQNLASRILNLSGTSTVATLTASAVGNTVSYNGSGPQNIVGTNYYHLSLSGAPDTSSAFAKTASGVLTVAGTLTVNSGNSLNMGTFSGSTFGGSSVNNGKIRWASSNAYVAGTGTTEFYGSLASTVAPGSNYGNILFTGGGTMTISGLVTATGGTAATGVTVYSNLTVAPGGNLTVTGMDLNNNGAITNNGTISVQ